jgi:hypothetical protein
MEYGAALGGKKLREGEYKKGKTEGEKKRERRKEGREREG